MSTVSPGESTSIKTEAALNNEANDSNLQSPTNSLNILDPNDSKNDDDKNGSQLPEVSKDPVIKKESPVPESIQTLNENPQDSFTNSTTTTESHTGDKDFDNKFFSLNSLDRKDGKISDHDFSFLEDNHTLDGASKISHDIDLTASAESLQNESHDIKLEHSFISGSSDQKDIQDDPKETSLMFKNDKKSTDSKSFNDSNMDLENITIEDHLKHLETLEGIDNFDTLTLRNLANLNNIDQYDNLEDSLGSLNNMGNLTDKIEKISGSSKEQTMSPEKSDLFGDASSNMAQIPDLSNLSDISGLKESSKSPSNDLVNFSIDRFNEAISAKDVSSRLSRAQSEALETTVQKPKLHSYSASVPQSPTLQPSNPLLPSTNSSNSSLKQSQTRASSPSSNNKKASRLSSLSKIHSDKSSTLQAINASLEKPEVHHIQTDEAPRVSAYARLDFPSFTFYVQTLQVSLGRSAEKGSGMVDVDLGPVKAISRRHAKIFYNFGTQRFELSVLGRNGAFVDDSFVDTGSTVPLQNGTKIQIGQISFSFVLPSANSSRGSQEPEEARRPTASIPIKQEDSTNTTHSTSNDLAGKSQSAVTRSPSLAGVDSDSTQIGSEANKQSSQGPSLTKDIKTESKPVPKPPTKKQSTRREYLPEEIPEEYREKPAFSYSHLIATALRAHPEASGISLSEIYKSIQDIFPYYKYCPHGWQNSVRHNLSSNKAFRKISKEGKGWLWGIDEEYFQERERLKKKAAVSLKAKTAAVVSTTTKGKQLLNEKDSQQEQQQIDQLSYQQSQLHYQQQTQQFHQQNQQFQQQLQAQAQNKSSSTGLSDPSTFIPSFYTDHKNTTHRTPHVLETAPIPFSSIPPSISNPTNLPPEALADLNSVYDREFAQKQNKHQQQQQQANDSSSTSESNPVSTFSLNPVPTTVAALSKPTTPVSASAPVKKERAKTIAELASEIQIDSSNDRLYRPDYANGSRESLTERKKSAPSSDVTVTAVTSAKPTPATSSSTSIHMMPAVATNSIAQNDAILNSPRYQQYYANSALTPPVPSTRVTNAISGFISSSQASPASVSSPAGSSSNPARGQGSVQSMAAGQNTFRMTQAPKLSGPPSQATQSQLQMQTSVPQMRVNPQIPQGVRDPKASGTSASLSPVAATAGSPGVSTTSGSPVPSTGNWQSQSRTGKSVSPPAPSVASSPSVSSIPVTNATAAAATSSAASKPVAKTNVASSASSGTGTAARKPAVNANLSNLNLPKETLRILTLLQDKIKAQMEASGQVINSALLTNALAIAISQLTKNSGSGGGAAAITNLLKGKNQAQLVNALATAISSAKKTGGPSGSSSSTHGTKPKPVNPLATTSSSVPKPAPASAPMIPGLSKLHPPVTVPAAISSPASLNAGLPPHLSGITAKVPLSNMVPRVKQAQSPVPPPAGPAKSASNVDEKKSSPVLSRPTSAPASGITKPLPGFDTNKTQVPSLNKLGSSTAASKPPAYASEPMPPKITMPVPPAIRAALAAAAAASSASVKTSKSMSEPAPVKAATATSPVNASSPALGALSEGSKPKRPAPEQIQSPAIKKEKTEAGAVTVKSVEPPKPAVAPGSTLKHVPAAAASASAATLPAKSASPPPNPPAKPSAPLPATAPAAPQAATKPSAQQSPAPAKSKAEMISEMLAKASKLTNPTPSIKAALLQLQAHATKLGLPIPENLKRILNDDTPAAPPSGAPADAGADKKRKATPDGPSTVQNPKIQKTS